MKIGLKNIGTVKEAKIDLDKNLLIFCGPNNSGKTYVAYTLYGIYRSNQHNVTNPTLTTDTGDYVNGVNSFIISPRFIKDVLRNRQSQVSTELENVFASSQNFFDDSEISIQLELSDEQINAKVNSLNIENGQQSFLGNHYEVNKRRGSNTISLRNKNASLLTDTSSGYFDTASSTLIVSSLVTDLFFGNVYIAPAERIAINIFSKEVYLNRAGLLDTYKNPRSRYSLPIAASLQISEDLSFLEKALSDYSHIAKQIEDRILRGGISVSPTGEMLFSPANADLKNISINLAGSMVKSLASLVFYFRHLAKKSDFIIIDEPELNLHPDNQIIMARILALMVNEGFKVLISTHSDYIIKELNNLVRLNDKKAKAQAIMKEYGYSEDELLDKNALGVYLFRNNTATNLEVDELGFDVVTIEKVNSELAQISETIYFDLFDNDSE
jgi:predicted ATPase